jgi:hypothetical protein
VPPIPVPPVRVPPVPVPPVPVPPAAARGSDGAARPDVPDRRFLPRPPAFSPG